MDVPRRPTGSVIHQHQHEPVPRRSRRMTAATEVEDGYLATGLGRQQGRDRQNMRGWGLSEDS